MFHTEFILQIKRLSTDTKNLKKKLSNCKATIFFNQECQKAKIGNLLHRS